MSVSRAAKLVALSREAQDQSVVAISRSLRLLRRSAYPEDRSHPSEPPSRDKVDAGPPAK